MWASLDALQGSKCMSGKIPTRSPFQGRQRQRNHEDSCASKISSCPSNFLVYIYMPHCVPKSLSRVQREMADPKWNYSPRPVTRNGYCYCSTKCRSEQQVFITLEWLFVISCNVIQLQTSPIPSYSTIVLISPTSTSLYLTVQQISSFETCISRT